METETKSDQDGDSKDKKDDDEDMSLDWRPWTLWCIYLAASVL